MRSLNLVNTISTSESPKCTARFYICAILLQPTLELMKVLAETDVI